MCSNNEYLRKCRPNSMRHVMEKITICYRSDVYNMLQEMVEDLCKVIKEQTVNNGKLFNQQRSHLKAMSS